MKKILIPILIGLILGASACGYNFRGKQNNLPSDIRTVAIPVFENHTGELRIERIFTDEVIFQFTRSQMLRVTSQGQTDAVLKGIIKTVHAEDVSLTSQVTSRQRRLTVVVEAKLVRTSDNSVLWEDKELQQYRIYTVSGGSIQATDSAKTLAMTELARSLAQTLHDRVFENF